MFLKGNHSYFSIINFELPYLARLYQVPCMIFGAGASRILSEEAERHIGRSLTYCNRITVRDEGSKEILSRLPYAEKCNIEVTADPVFRLTGQALSSSEQCTLEYLKAQKKPLIGVSLRNWDLHGNNEKTVTAVANAINDFIEQNGGTIVLLPFDDGGILENISKDSLILNQLEEQLNSNANVLRLSGYLKPAYALTLIKECTLSICMRLHPTIMSVSAGVPVLGLEYDPKVRNIMKMCNVEDQCIDIGEIDSDSVLERLNDLYTNYSQIRNRELTAAKTLREKAFQNIQYVWELLEHKAESPKRDELMEALIKAFFDNLEKEYLQKIQILFNDMKYLDVIELTACMADDSCSADIIYKMAFSYHQAGDSEHALKYYNMALEKGFSEFWVRYNRGQLYASLENRDKAKTDLIKAYKLNPERDDLLTLLKNIMESKV